MYGLTITWQFSAVAPQLPRPALRRARGMTVLTSTYSGRKEARLAHIDAMLLQREAAVPAHLVRVEGRVGVGARVTPTLHLP